jgi:catechol 2,3-dioxygenase-like lactoylglutathione lyase family enzyme
MLEDARITAFLATTQPARAAAFYTETLGLRLLSEDGFALVFEVDGVELRIQKVEHLAPHAFTSLGWRVADVDATVKALAERGVRFERYPGLEQDPAAIWRAPSGARIAWFHDPDGNLLSVTGPAGFSASTRTTNR